MECKVCNEELSLINGMMGSYCNNCGTPVSYFEEFVPSEIEDSLEND